ncbi:MAG: amidohydrolase [Dehalococcoidia bacterium]|nr:amidohydrolase [Dehalococcoidia bacterium]
MIVDSHVHVISSDRSAYPLFPPSGQVGGWVKDKPVTAEQLIESMGEAGVDKAVLVQPFSAYGVRNSYVANSAQEHPNRFAGVCILDMMAPDATESLDYWVWERGIRGLRLFTMPGEDASWLDDPKTFPVWDRAKALRIPVCVFTNNRHLPRLRRVLDRYPELPVALDHLGFHADQGFWSSLSKELLELAELPKLYLKFSTENIYAARKAGVSLQTYLEPLLAGFGPRRLMWGSNYSNTHDRPYGEMVKLAQDELTFLSPEDREWVFSGTALILWPELKGRG